MKQDQLKDSNKNNSRPEQSIWQGASLSNATGRGHRKIFQKPQIKFKFPQLEQYYVEDIKALRIDRDSIQRTNSFFDLVDHKQQKQFNNNTQHPTTLNLTSYPQQNLKSQNNLKTQQNTPTAQNPPSQLSKQIPKQLVSQQKHKQYFLYVVIIALVIMMVGMWIPY